MWTQISRRNHNKQRHADMPTADMPTKKSKQTSSAMTTGKALLVRSCVLLLILKRVWAVSSLHNEEEKEHHRNTMAFEGGGHGRVNLFPFFHPPSEGVNNNHESVDDRNEKDEADDATADDGEEEEDRDIESFWDFLVDEMSSIATTAPTSSSQPSNIPSTMSSSQDPSASPTSSSRPSQSPTSFMTVLSLQDIVGVCGGAPNGIGCANEPVTMGNPNDLVNCYNITNFGGFAPYFVDAVTFWVGNSIDLPGDMSVRIWNGSTGGGPTSLLFNQSIPTGDYRIGKNTFNLGTDVEIASEEVCIGVFSMALMDGLRIQAELGEGDQSYILAPNCGIVAFAPLNEQVLTNTNFCIEASVFG
jgi:hypothetical protein